MSLSSSMAPGVSGDVLLVSKHRLDGAAAQKGTDGLHGNSAMLVPWTRSPRESPGTGWQPLKGTRADMANFRAPPCRSHLFRGPVRDTLGPLHPPGRNRHRGGGVG